MSKGIWTILLILAMSALSGQSFERKLFSNGGGNGTVGLFTYSVSFGEPIIGTDQSSIPSMTRGFHQPVPLVLLRQTILGPLALRDEAEGLWLDWHTEMNQGADFFVVEFAPQGDNYRSLHIAFAQGISDTLQSYRFLHRHPQGGYYRIQMQLSSGETQRGNPVYWQPDEGRDWDVQMNAATGQWVLRGGAPDGGPISFSLWNIAGQLLMEEKHDTPSPEYPFSLTPYSEGIYVLRVQQAGRAASLRLRHIVP
ncbi:MAG: hypothetical protein AAFV07_00235 [Bacteroidota bacterium]